MNRSSLRIRLSAAILKTHGVVAQWMTATAVKEKAPGGGVWQGDVQTFALVRHPTAQYCYAWAEDMGESTQIFMALKVPPINSPADAVREYLAKRNKPTKT